jgi:anti-anti-sigma factor
MEFTEYREDGRYDIHMRGRLTFADHAHFLEILKQIGAGKFTEIRFDISQLDFIDSAAMGMFLLALEEANKFHTSITLIGAKGQVKRMLHVARFEALFTMED